MRVFTRKLPCSPCFVTISLRDNEWESGKQWFTTNISPPPPPPLPTILQKHSWNSWKKGNKKYINNMTVEVSEQVRKEKQHKEWSSTSRIVTPATVENWKSDLAKHNAAEWIQYTVNKDGIVADMKCKFCITYQDDIKDLPNFSDIFIVGSRSYKQSAVEEHATKCKPHLKAY